MNFNGKKKQLPIIFALFCLLILQLYLNKSNSRITPKLEILSQSPSPQTLLISSLGNKQSYFRLLTVKIQNAGDTFGRFAKLQDYDYRALRDWFIALDTLDDKSSILPATASYYFSNTQQIEDNRYLIEYIEQNYDRGPINKWWWLAQAVEIARFKLQDKDLALRLAIKLMNNSTEKTPNWIKQLPAIIYSEMGENELAYTIMRDLADKYDNYSQSDLNYMNFFIQEKLKLFDKRINKKPEYNNAPVY